MFELKWSDGTQAKMLQYAGEINSREKDLIKPFLAFSIMWVLFSPHPPKLFSTNPIKFTREQTYNCSAAAYTLQRTEFLEKYKQKTK